MTKKELELLHRNHLLASGPDKMWCIDDLRLSTENLNKRIAKRTLERWISSIPWLKSSHHTNDQLDELNQPALQLVLNSFIMRAQRNAKRRYLFNFIVFLALVIVKNPNNITYWLQKMEKGRNVGAYCTTTKFHHC